MPDQIKGLKGILESERALHLTGLTEEICVRGYKQGAPILLNMLSSISWTSLVLSIEHGAEVRNYDYFGRSLSYGDIIENGN